MQKWLVGSLSALTIGVFALTGCSTTSSLNGFIDKGGNLVVDVDKLNPKPVAIGDYHEDLAPVEYSGGVGALDKSGRYAFQKPYRHIARFFEGKAAYSVGTSDDDQKWGYLNVRGETVIQPAYSAAKRFSGGLAAVRMPEGSKNAKSGGRWSYIDEHGKQVVPGTFEQADLFAEGLAPVKSGGRMGCIDMQGRFVIPATYDVVYGVNDGNIVAATGDGWTGSNSGQELDYFDKTGHKLAHKVINPTTLENYRPMLWIKSDAKTVAERNAENEKLSRPLSKFVSPGYSEGKSIGQAGTKFVIEQNFNARAFSGGYDYVFPVSDGFIVVYNDADGGKMDYRGGVPEDASGIWNSKSFRFWDAAPFSNGLGLVEETKNGPYGYIDKTGNFILKPIYPHARPFFDDRALVGESALHDIQN